MAIEQQQDADVSHKARPAIAAGRYYPAEPEALADTIRRLLDEAQQQDITPRGLIVPHAEYQVAGPVMASGYKLLPAVRETAKRVVLIGPSLAKRLDGLAATDYQAFKTPLGSVDVDREAVAVAAQFPQVVVDDQAHEAEWVLEVQLPWLQVLLPGLRIVPLLAGRTTAYDVAQVLEKLWTDETLVIVVSNLCRDLDYWSARYVDRDTAYRIEHRNWRSLLGVETTNHEALDALLKLAEDRNLTVQTLDLRNSGDLTGQRDRVTGFGAFAVF